LPSSRAPPGGGRPGARVPQVARAASVRGTPWIEGGQAAQGQVRSLCPTPGTAGLGPEGQGPGEFPKHLCAPQPSPQLEPPAQGAESRAAEQEGSTGQGAESSQLGREHGAGSRKQSSGSGRERGLEHHSGRLQGYSSSADYASDGSASEVFEAPSPSEPDSWDGAREPKARTETPIEREIRLALEREETLRKERGLEGQSNSRELVEIHTKPLLAMSRSPPPGRKGKDKGRASFYVQREIEQEIQREEALKREGRLLGAYDKGPQQELGERRKVFEQDEATPAPAKSPESASDPTGSKDSAPPQTLPAPADPQNQGCGRCAGPNRQGNCLQISSLCLLIFFPLPFCSKRTFYYGFVFFSLKVENQTISSEISFANQRLDSIKSDGNFTPFPLGGASLHWGKGVLFCF
uniref:A-kinase anchor protein 2 C-terminal domain-containing protein n=1 Tax=Crocodylus porosus TaxID=8502 RepID=A0A7M4FC39_CROPO